MKISLLNENEDEKAQEAEHFIFEALTPGGFADSGIPIPRLKDRLAWVTSSNLLREEQPTVLAYDGKKLVAILTGEPVETTFDVGEAEITDVFCLPEYETIDLVRDLMKVALDFYEKQEAKQVHVWCLKSDYDSGKMNLKCRVAVEDLAFEFKGFERVSKWTGKEIVKLEKDL